MIKERMRTVCVLAALAVFSVLAGCGGGGGSSSGGSGGSSAPDIEVVPASYDFGTVTTGNSPSPLEVKINNNGSAALSVSGIALTDPVNFSLNLSGGSNPCSTASPTIAAGGTCTFEVTFQPQSNSSFNSGVAVNSNDSGTPISVVALSGVSSELTALEVVTNQIDKTDCPVDITAYVSVLDQGGYPVVGLTDSDFDVNEFGDDTVTFSVATGSVNLPPIAITALMDYSTSITDSADTVSDMESGLVAFMNNLRGTDDAAVIKFATELEVVQAFTNDKNVLAAAITAPFDRGEFTLLWDSIYKAIEDTTSQRPTNRRKAIIVITDGIDDDGSGGQLSTRSYDDVVALAQANDIPIFPIGIGSYAINIGLLGRLADDTHGRFFEAQNSDNLQTIFQQLSSLLFENQYAVTYQTEQGNVGVPGALLIEATAPGTAITDSYTRNITACP